nr:DUF4251 domain-containing protein [uncultured Carboxylicivirga sp.]
MKTIVALFIVGIIGLNYSQNSYSQDKNSRKEKQKEEFAETLQLIESGNYMFVPDRALPLGGGSFDLSSHFGFLKITDNNADSDMPFFGRAFQASYGNTEGGMKFKGEMLEKKIEINERKNSIEVIFKVSDNDFYKVRISIFSGGSATVGITSNNRSFISYYGRISAIPEEKDE